MNNQLTSLEQIEYLERMFFNEELSKNEITELARKYKLGNNFTIEELLEAIIEKENYTHKQYNLHLSKFNELTVVFLIENNKVVQEYHF